MSKKRYLTKSKFSVAFECPRKLFYIDKENIYANRKLTDPFLEALAEGGYQVGELAKYYFPGGHNINTLDKKKALQETNELLKQDNVVIYEAAITSNGFFLRADILVKNGKNIKLIEVKSKSIKKSKLEELRKKEFEPYLYDIAFQKYVAQYFFNDYMVNAYLMLVDKDSVCPTDNLNQKFKVIKNKKNYKEVEIVSYLTKEDVSEKLLIQIPVDDFCDVFYKKTYPVAGNDVGFAEMLDIFAENYINDKKIPGNISSICSSCEFKATSKDNKKGLKSGFFECWHGKFGLSKNDIKESIVLNIWDFRRKNRFINEGKIKLSLFTKDDIGLKPNKEKGLSPSQRQWLQVEKVKNNDKTFYLDKENLKKEMNKWVYPLHFIDFETSRVAIPFNKGRHPYEAIAFQFSHHIINENGNVEHEGQYINTNPGEFPNYDFIRNLKSQLDKDKGSVFCYSPHENTFLNDIYLQLKKDKKNIPDSKSLCDFIKTITKSKKSGNGSIEEWTGDRVMIDMKELVLKYYYDPDTKGSNSLKFILPAILNSSEYLKDKYSKPVYGAKNGIPSLNYKDWTWVKFNEFGYVIDPYKLLPKVFEDISEDDNEKMLSDIKQLNNGGIAMTAYSKLQFSDVPDFEREVINSALLKYCELDTLAMVMLYEGLKSFIRN